MKPAFSLKKEAKHGPKANLGECFKVQGCIKYQRKLMSKTFRQAKLLLNVSLCKTLWAGFQAGLGNEAWECNQANVK